MKARFFKFREILLWILSLFLFAGLSNADDVASAFNDANKLYEQGKFSEAVSRYEKIIQSKSISAPLYFNLGNAYFKSGQLGRAVLAYRNAERLSPRDPEIRANLQFARNQAGGGKSAGESLWEKWIKILTLNEWTILTSSVLSFWFLILAIRQWRAGWKNSFRGLSATLGFLALMLVVCLVSALHQQSMPISVVIVPEAVVRRGPWDESPSVFTLRDGTEVKVLDRKNEWLEIVDRSRRTGWLSEKQVMPLHVP